MVLRPIERAALISINAARQVLGSPLLQRLPRGLTHNNLCPVAVALPGCTVQPSYVHTPDPDTACTICYAWTMEPEPNMLRFVPTPHPVRVFIEAFDAGELPHLRLTDVSNAARSIVVSPTLRLALEAEALGDELAHSLIDNTYGPTPGYEWEVRRNVVNDWTDNTNPPVTALTLQERMRKAVARYRDAKHPGAA